MARATFFIFLLLAGSGQQVQAAQVTARINHTSEYTTNTARTETDEIAEWLHRPGFDVAIEHAGADLELDAGYRYQRRIYEEDVWQDESASTGSAEMRWHAMPQRMDVRLRNTRTESTLRATDAQTQDNRQIVSYTELSPVLLLYPRSGDNLELQYTYTDVAVAKTKNDSTLHTMSGRYIFGLPGSRALALETRFTDVDYDDVTSPDVQAWTNSLTYEYEGREITLSLAGGYMYTDRTLGRDPVDGPTFDIQAEWARGSSSITVTASQQITDRASELRSGDLGYGESINENSDLNELMTERRGDMTWRSRIGQTEVSLNASAGQEDYEDSPRDSKRLSVAIGISRRLTQLTDFDAGFSFTNREFDQLVEEYDDYTARIALSRQFGRKLSLALRVLYNKRVSNLEGGNYEEWVPSLNLSYALLGPNRR